MTFNSTPPRGLPQVILKQKECYMFWLTLHRNFPKVERFGIGSKIENCFLSILELTFQSAYLPLELKVITITKAISRLDVLKFFMQLAWESKLIPTEKYSELTLRIGEIGRMLGGWKKGLETKTPSAKI